MAGQWDVRIEYETGNVEHALFLEQQGAEVRGRHQGELLAGELRGTVRGDEIHFRSLHAKNTPPSHKQPTGQA